MFIKSLFGLKYEFSSNGAYNRPHKWRISQYGNPSADPAGRNSNSSLQNNEVIASGERHKKGIERGQLAKTRRTKHWSIKINGTQLYFAPLELSEYIL